MSSVVTLFSFSFKKSFSCILIFYTSIFVSIIYIIILQSPYFSLKLFPFHRFVIICLCAFFLSSRMKYMFLDLFWTQHSKFGNLLVFVFCYNFSVYSTVLQMTFVVFNSSVLISVYSCLFIVKGSIFVQLWLFQVSYKISKSFIEYSDAPRQSCKTIRKHNKVTPVCRAFPMKIFPRARRTIFQVLLQ